MLEAGGFNWDEQMKKTFLNNAININLREVIIATPIPTTYIGYCDLFHGVNNNLEALRTKKKRQIGGNLPANRSTESFAGNSAGNFIGNSVESTTDEIDWSATTNVAAATTVTTNRRAKWVSQEVINERRAKGACFRCGIAGHKVGNCSFLPPKRPVQAATTTTTTPTTPKQRSRRWIRKKKIAFGLNRGQELKPFRNVLRQKWNEF